MKTIIYDPVYGQAIADAKIESFVQEFLNSDYDQLIVGNENIIDQFRLEVKKGNYDYQKIVFVFNGATISMDKNGRILKWPVGFCDYQDKRLCELVS